jgi:hypothetical protein
MDLECRNSSRMFVVILLVDVLQEVKDGANVTDG